MDQYSFNSDGIIYNFPLHPGDKDKYIVFTCAKNEDPYIEEWVCHYLGLGFDKIIICDNNDEAGRLIPILGQYINNGSVEIFPCKDIDILQIPFYTQYCQVGNYKWCAYFDVDEFLEIPSFRSIKDFIATVDDDVDVVCFNWLMYAFNNKVWKEPGRVQDRFPRPMTPVLYQKENVFIKSIIRGDHANKEDSYFISAHTIRNNARPLTYAIGGYYKTNHLEENSFPLRYKNGYLKHYYTKSVEEWQNKTSRGWADGTRQLNQLNPLFYAEDNNFKIENYYIGPFVRKIESTEDNDGSIPQNYDVIKVTSSNGNYYSLFMHLMRMLGSASGKTYLLDFDNIDDTTFVIYNEYAILTGNRVIARHGNQEEWDFYLRYNNHREFVTYYIIDCF